MKPWVIPEDVLTGCETSSLDLVPQRLNVPHQQQQSVPQRLKSAVLLLTPPSATAFQYCRVHSLMEQDCGGAE